MKKTSIFEYPVFRSWALLAFRKRRNYIVAILLFIVMSTIHSNDDLVFRLASRQQRRGTSNQRPKRDTQLSIGPASNSQLSKAHSSASSEDAVFRRVDQLLTAVDPSASPECLYFYRAGGRCFRCLPGEGSSDISFIDGEKPVCLKLLRPNCSVLSFGVNHDFSFEEVMEDLGCVVHAFDPTMGVDSYRRSKGIHFHSVGIGSTDSDMGGFPIASLGSIVRKTRLQTGVIDYLKLDVETSEWETLHQQLTTSGDLLRVRQLNVEFHLFQWSPQIAEGDGMKEPKRATVSYEDAVRFVAVLEALNKAGFALALSDPNLLCMAYDGGCLSFLYDTHWINKRMAETSVV